MQMLLYHIIYLIQYQVLHTASSANDLHCKAGDFNTLNCLTKKKKQLDAVTCWDFFVCF